MVTGKHSQSMLLHKGHKMAKVSDLFRDIRSELELHPLDADLISIEAQERYGLSQAKALQLIALLEQEICEDEERDTWLDNQREAALVA